LKPCLFQSEPDPGGIVADHNLVRQDLGHDAADFDKSLSTIQEKRYV